MSTARPLGITYLLANARERWGGVQTVLLEADALTRRGHAITVLCRTGMPDWHDPSSNFVPCEDFHPCHIPESDIIVGTFCTTVPSARNAGFGRTVHYCQGYEGDNPEQAEFLHLIEGIYRLPGVIHLAIAPFLARRLKRRFGFDSIVVPYGIQEHLFRPATPRKGEGLRVGLVGPWEVPWKDICTGVEAAKFARKNGVPIELVRISASPLCQEERELWGDLPVEWHEMVPQEEMGDLYRSLDLFLGSTLGGAEGFFLPAIEAMACGIPCILTDIVCFRHYSERQDYALFTPAGDHVAMATKIGLLHDREDLRRELRERGLEVAKPYTFSRHVDRLEQVFQEIVPAGQALSERSKAPHEPAESLPALEEYDALRSGFDYDEMRYRLSASMLEAAAGASTKGDINWAVQVAEAATALFPDLAEAWQTHGRLLCHLGFFKEAEPSLEVLGRLCFATQRFDEAIQHFRDSILIGMPGEQIYVELAMAYWLAGKHKGAVLSLEEAIRRNPRNGMAHTLLYKIRKERARTAEARAGVPAGKEL
ncbi:MAG: glycosyltransferase [Planctomycetota bacterium]